MTREQVEKMAEDMCYTKEEIYILLQGFELGMEHARDLLVKAVFNETN